MLEISPGGRYVASYGHDRLAYVWEVEQIVGGWVSMRGSIRTSSLLWLLLGCSADDVSASVGDGAATSAGTSASTGADTTSGLTATSQPPVDCRDVDIPGCAMVVEVCQAGECECLCAEAPTTDAPDTETAGEAGCPPEAVNTDPPAVCDEPGTSCATADGCCLCDMFTNCPEPHWWCAVPDPRCPEGPPTIDSPCEGIMSCAYCDERGVPLLRTCWDGGWTIALHGCDQ